MIVQNHLLPIHTKKLVVNCLFLPLLDYGDLVWGDRNNVISMNHLQILHNKAAKCVLDMPSYASSNEALDNIIGVHCLPGEDSIIVPLCSKL